MALTAARCSVYCCTGSTLEWFHTSSYRETAKEGGGEVRQMGKTTEEMELRTGKGDITP